jgi:selenocysteine lyase/cysteine desulfurase
MALLAPPTLSALREREFPLVSETTYLNAATQGPLSARARAAVEQALVRAQFPETQRARVDQPPAELARARLARLLHVEPDSLVFSLNTTHGLNICAHGIDWRPGDNVVLPEREFPSLARTWLNLRAYGVEVRLVPYQGAGPSVDAIMAAVDGHTRAVSCSAVAWDTGYRIDLEALGRRCARAGCLLVVDGIQLVGAAEIDPAALGISALSFHGYKWLVAGFGCGAMYVAPGAVDQIRPRFVGEQSYAQDGEHGSEAWQPGARRYHTSGMNILAMAALAGSLELIEEAGLTQIEAHNRMLSGLLVGGLQRLAPDVQLVTPADEHLRAAIVVFTLGDGQRDAALAHGLAEQGFTVALRPRGVRVSPHFYNTADEIERLLGVLPGLIRSAS